MTDIDVRPNSLAAAIDAAVASIEADVVAWRRDLHAHPELGNREFRTAGIVAAHLRKLGFDEVRTEVAYTGVVGLLKGARARPGGRAACRHGRPAGRRTHRRAVRARRCRRPGTARRSASCMPAATTPTSRS